MEKQYIMAINQQFLEYWDKSTMNTIGNLHIFANLSFPLVDQLGIQ